MKVSHLRNGEKAIYIDVTGGLPDMHDFRINARHELWHKRKELEGKKEMFYDEMLASLAGYFDFIITGKIPSPLKCLNRVLSRGEERHGPKK